MNLPAPFKSFNGTTLLVTHGLMYIEGKVHNSFIYFLHKTPVKSFGNRLDYKLFLICKHTCLTATRAATSTLPDARRNMGLVDWTWTALDWTSQNVWNLWT